MNFWKENALFWCSAISAGKSSLSANNISVVTNLTASSIQGTSLLSAGTGGITTSGNLSSDRDFRSGVQA